MKHLFIPYDIALLAKENKFNGECIAKYARYNFNDPIELYPHSQNFFKGSHFETCSNEWYYEGDEKEKVAAPMHEDLVEWFEKQHELRIDVICGTLGLKDGTMYKIRKSNIESDRKNNVGQPRVKKLQEGISPSYDRRIVLEGCLREAFKLLQ